MNWTDKLKQLLQLEVEEEAAVLADRITSLSGKMCEQEGLAIINLETIEIQTALFGRCNITMQKIGKLPIPNGLRVGDEVHIISPRPDSEPLFGLIKRISPATVEIIIEEYDNALDETPLRINLHPSAKTHEKMIEALSYLSEHSHPLTELLYNPHYAANYPRERLFTAPVEVKQWYNSSINVSQQEAVLRALQATQIALIHGPVSFIISFLIPSLIY
jgi:hypothetical protein